MPIDKERQPVIVGVGRFTQFPKPVEECLNPVGMMVESARRAAIDAVGHHRSNDLLKDHRCQSKSFDASCKTLSVTSHGILHFIVEQRSSVF